MATGKVIKGEGPADSGTDSLPGLRPPRSAVVNAEVYEAQRSTQALLDEARKHALEIVDAAQKERDRILEEARALGREQGYAEVAEQLIRARLLQSRVLQSAEPELVALACRIAERLLGRDLERDPRLVVDLCAQAIEGVRGAQQLVIRVHPGDVAILREHKPRLMELIGRVREIAIKEDAEVGRYGCIIETDAGTIDAQLSTQLEMLGRLLQEESSRNARPA